ncbi:peptidoglycan D,D-transpeptidase FtsI family protein [Goodfellowiella coeruleoviolacea]|uniref:Peptidoglycan glycosyltransferase n=1 Tax=Goodfellowiella coeruleoviolacea TaxID=334858 RepID=A0AAE3GIT6_9PSEU|nr:penicillin-binding protein 2 [Goodfellowiella coeruleoviolacea]MCP2168991.1 peptidoglycan glycosyltransferase [Goodfellowiella coeruleoviolacea]
MNTPMRRVGLAMMVMVLLLLANATYVQIIAAERYRTNDANQRVLLDQYGRKRGQIIAADGQPLASVQETNDRLRYLRTYPKGLIYSPVTGYYSTSYGSAGMERIEDDVLNGDDDRLIVNRLSDVITGRDPQGGSVQLTINPAAQETAYNQMTEKGFTGSVVAIKPDTGEILAMVNTPSYDPNLLATHDEAAQKNAYTELDKAEGNPLRNKAVQDIYPPGSTFKLVVAAAALENGATKDTQLPAQAEIQLPNTNTTLENFNHTTCGSGQTASLQEALARSCNTAFAQLAGDLGTDKLKEQAAKFGFGEQGQEIPLRVQPSSVGDIPDKAALYQSGIGQRDVVMTPLQDAVVAATIANGGVRMQPHLVSKVLSPNLSELETVDPEEVGEAVTPATAATLRDMMIASEQRTSGGGKLQGVTIASKTGTAEHGTDPKNTNPHAWYVAFAPAEKPEVAVAVLVENGGDRGLEATGGSVAAPIGRAVIGAVLGGS